MDVKSIIIDCDTGVDDALALLLALRSPALSVRGITTVSGNVTLDKVVPNTLRVVEHAGRHTSVYLGAAASLLGHTITAEMIHGSDGLGDLDFPPPAAEPQKQHAVDFLVDTYLNEKNPPQLVTLGPLTNVALALPFLYTGSLLLESFFGIPGLGYLSLNAIHSSDVDVVRAVVLVGALLFTAANILADVALAWADPRVQLS